MDFSTISQFIQNISSASFNLGLILAVLAASAFYIWLLSRDKILSILLATYVSYGLIYIFPYSLWLGHLTGEKLILFKLFLFIVGAVLFSLIFILTKTMKGDSGGFFIFRWLKSVLFAISQFGLLISVLMSLMPINWLVEFSSLKQIFISPLAKFIWFVAPFVILIITKRPKRRGPGRPMLM